MGKLKFLEMEALRVSAKAPLRELGRVWLAGLAEFHPPKLCSVDPMKALWAILERDLKSLVVLKWEGAPGLSMELQSGGEEQGV